MKEYKEWKHEFFTEDAANKYLNKNDLQLMYDAYYASGGNLVSNKRHERKEETGGDPVDESLVGIRGWLILPAIGMALAPFSIIFLLGFEGPAAYKGFSFLLWVIKCVTSVCFFSKKSSTPGLVVFCLIAAVIAPLPFTDSLHAADGRAWLSSVVAAIIWIPYFLKSRRVKATFRK